MTQNFYALCRQQNGLTIKRIPLNILLQSSLVQLFDDQETAFMHGITSEEPYTGDWEREADEIYTIDNHAEIAAVLQTTATNAQSIANIDVQSFAQENVKAILTRVTIDGSTKLLIQSFSSRQILLANKVILFQNNHFNGLADPAFMIADKLACIVENGVLKFKSYHVSRSIFDLTAYYLHATDEDIDDFFDTTSHFSVDNIASFKSGVADQVIRKRIHSILTKRDIAQYTSTQITTAASDVGLTLHCDANGKIILPDDRGEAKNILHFLDDKLYEAPLSGQVYQANSHKAV